MAANPGGDRDELSDQFAKHKVPWKSLVYPEVENATAFGRTGGDVAAIFTLVDPDGLIRYKRVVPFGEDPKVTQKLLDPEIDKLCKEFKIRRSK